MNNIIIEDFNYARSLIEASLDPLVTINAEGKIMDVNEALIKVTGIGRQNLIGTDFSYYFTDAKKAKEGYLQVFRNGFVNDYPLTIMHKNGNLTDVSFNASEYRDDAGEVVGIVIVARDVTEQKRIAKDLTEAMLFAEMATLIAEEAKMKADKDRLIAEDAVKAKQQFLSNMSHEIRTPMNAIIGFAKVLLKSELTEKQEEYLNAIKVSGDALIVLINDILDLAKVDAGKMTFEQIPFRMSSSIAAMLHLYGSKIQERNLELVKVYDDRIPAVLIGDSLRLHQIISNLVSNAVKFTTKGKITISVKLLDENDQRVTLEFAVSDTGIGIPNSRIDAIFENFQQASSNTSRIYGGTGLGLAIVKQLVEAQDGSIKVISEIDKGSTFSFMLSFYKTDADPEMEKKLTEYGKEMTDKRILVVEDIPLNQLLMKTLLDDFGFECDIAGNGLIAIEKMKATVYDLILMDLQMPEMNGFEATDYIRNVMDSNIPIIALTADVTTVDLAKCKAVGMNDYIAKPVDERVLYSKMIELIKKSTIKVAAKRSVVEEVIKIRYTDLSYLSTRTKANKLLMEEMISLYLEQTPPLINAMKEALSNKDWQTLQDAVHKMIPSFSIMGISADFENIAKRIHEYASSQQEAEDMAELVSQIDKVCTQACEELMEELSAFKKIYNED
ncbi:MAG: ATP-binding protein [Gelidibacter sp.]